MKSIDKRYVNWTWSSVWNIKNWLTDLPGSYSFGREEDSRLRHEVPNHIDFTLCLLLYIINKSICISVRLILFSFWNFVLKNSILLGFSMVLILCPTFSLCSLSFLLHIYLDDTRSLMFVLQSKSYILWVQHSSSFRQSC